MSSLGWHLSLLPQDGAEMLRNYVKPNERIRIPAPVSFPKGTTPVLPRWPTSANSVRFEALTVCLNDVARFYH